MKNGETNIKNNVLQNEKLISSLENEIIDFLYSKKRNDMFVGEKYYAGNHDILNRIRTIIGKNGGTDEVDNLPNNKIVDNQYSRIVDQKNSYLLSKPITIYSEQHSLTSKINKVFDKSFFRLIKDIGEDSINCGISFMYIFLNNHGEIKFKRFMPYEVIPIWEDDEHSTLKMLIRIYDIEKLQNEKITVISRVELYTKKGIYHFIFDGEKLKQDYGKEFIHYIYDSNNEPLYWDKIPIISFKFNSKEIPLINKVKTLQDALNTVRSDFMNNMQEDARNTILVLKNYDGTNISEFRKNLSEYGVVKVKTIDGNEGGVETLKVDINSNNYEVLAKTLKKAIIENARGYDAKDDRVGQNPNQMNIQSMYADIDLDANLMETEFQESFENILWFIKKFIKYKDNIDFSQEYVQVIFNRDMLINEVEAINNCVKSKEILSDSTIISRHPWVSNLDKEIERIQNQKDKKLKMNSIDLKNNI